MCVTATIIIIRDEAEAIPVSLALMSGHGL